MKTSGRRREKVETPIEPKEKMVKVDKQKTEEIGPAKTVGMELR